MSKFFNPQTAQPTSNGDAESARLFAPATERNRSVIRDVMTQHLDGLRGTLVEVASGTGEHAVHIAPHLPNIMWQPTDIEDRHLDSINAWRTHTGCNNILPAKHFNVIENDFPDISQGAHICAVAAMNLIHIAPWRAAENLIEKAGICIKDGVLMLYGPYKRGGEHTSESNADFDRSLKSRDPAWGIRDIEAVIACADKAGFDKPTIIQMPANNLSLVFHKAG